jgi:toxin YoeB
MVERPARRLLWTAAARADYVYWEGPDRKSLKRINALIQDALRHSLEGIGKPEPLRGSLSGFWSRRTDDVNRVAYSVEDDDLAIVACRYRYE